MRKKQEQGVMVGDEIVKSHCNIKPITAQPTVFTTFVIITLFSLLPNPGPVHATASDATHLVTSEARRQGVPVGFALKMARIESGIRCHNHNKRSSASGPLQVLRGTARSMGYRGDIRRASCATQTHYGMRHLAMCWRAAKGRPALAKRCHQQGISAVYGRRR